MKLQWFLLTALLATSCLKAVAGEFEDRVRAGEAQKQAEWDAKTARRRAQSHVVFEKLIVSVVNSRFGGFRDGVPQVSADSHDGGALYMGEAMGTSEFTTKTNLVCHAWGDAHCPVLDSKCYLTSTKVECADVHGKVTNSGWLHQSF